MTPLGFSYFVRNLRISISHHKYLDCSALRFWARIWDDLAWFSACTWPRGPSACLQGSRRDPVTSPECSGGIHSTVSCSKPHSDTLLDSKSSNSCPRAVWAETRELASRAHTALFPRSLGDFYSLAFVFIHFSLNFRRLGADFGPKTAQNRPSAGSEAQNHEYQNWPALDGSVTMCANFLPGIKLIM